MSIKSDGIYINGIQYDIIPPSPTETTRGGIIAKARTNEQTEVVIDSETGKAYVGATSQMQPDWEQTNSSSYDYIKNKPIIPTKLSELDNDKGFQALSAGTNIKIEESFIGNMIDERTLSNTTYSYSNGQIQTNSSYYGNTEKYPVVKGKKYILSCNSTGNVWLAISEWNADGSWKGTPNKYQNYTKIMEYEATANGFVSLNIWLNGVANSSTITDVYFGSTDSITTISTDNVYTKQEVEDLVDSIAFSKFPNLTIIGEPTINNGQMSGFSNTDYARFPFIVDFREKPFEINMCFTTGNNVTSQENIFDSQFGLAFAIQNSKFVLAISTNGTNWNFGALTGTHTILANTTYYSKIIWDGLILKLSYSTDKATYIDDISTTLSNSPYPKQIVIGVGDLDKANPKVFSGIINLNYCNLIISGKTVWQGMDDVGLATRMAVDMSNIDESGINRVKDIMSTDISTIIATSSSALDLAYSAMPYFVDFGSDVVAEDVAMQAVIGHKIVAVVDMQTLDFAIMSHIDNDILYFCNERYIYTLSLSNNSWNRYEKSIGGSGEGITEDRVNELIDVKLNGINETLATILGGE